jgi:hypothetical protein
MRLTPGQVGDLSRLHTERDSGGGNPLLDVLGPAIEEAVSVAVDGALGIEPARTTPDEAAAAILEAVAGFHEADLEGADRDLPGQLDERLGGGLRDEPEVLQAADDVVQADRGAHAAALTVLGGQLREALALPGSRRKQRVDELLSAERGRLEQFERSRVRRAMGNLKAAITLPDEALDAPRRQGGAIVEIPTAC